MTGKNPKRNATSIINLYKLTFLVKQTSGREEANTPKANRLAFLSKHVLADATPRGLQTDGWVVRPALGLQDLLRNANYLVSGKKWSLMW